MIQRSVLVKTRENLVEKMIIDISLISFYLLYSMMSGIKGLFTFLQSILEEFIRREYFVFEDVFSNPLGK